MMMNTERHNFRRLNRPCRTRTRSPHSGSLSGTNARLISIRTMAIARFPCDFASACFLAHRSAVSWRLRSDLRATPHAPFDMTSMNESPAAVSSPAGEDGSDGVPPAAFSSLARCFSRRFASRFFGSSSYALS